MSTEARRPGAKALSTEARRPGAEALSTEARRPGAEAFSTEARRPGAEALSTEARRPGAEAFSTEARRPEPTFLRDARISYDAVAEPYAAQFADELDRKPLDRALVDAFAAMVRATGLPGDVADLGCGPGHVTSYLGGLGLSPVGFDLSPRMVELAANRYPGLDVREASLLELPVPDGSWSGLLSLYSIIHLPRSVVPAAFREFRRVLRPGGVLLLGFHAGDGQLHLDEWFGHKVSFDGYLFDPSDIASELAAAGLTVDASVRRSPYPDIEAPTQRAYLFARR